MGIKLIEGKCFVCGMPCEKDCYGHYECCLELSYARERLIREESYKVGVPMKDWPLEKEKQGGKNNGASRGI